MSKISPLIIPCLGNNPILHDSCWVAPNATIIGAVNIGAKSSIWFQSVVRGDVASIEIGEKVNIQDGAIIHGTYNKSQTIIEELASIGHRAIVHGAHIKKGALIGMGAIIMDDAIVGEQAVVAAGSVVLEGTIIPPRTLWAGVPAKQKGAVKPELRKQLAATSERYVEYAEWFRF